MAENRKLATILALDVAGYSRAAEQDDEAAAKAVRLLREVITEIVAPFGGRIFNSAGDGFMIELPAASSGVQAAVALLRESRSGARPLPKIRVGVHLGEVIVESNGDLLGHGVNVAARLMALAEPGTAVVSDTVRSQVRAASELPFISQGRVQLDKMSERMQVFSLNPGERTHFAQIAKRRGARPIMLAAAALAVVVAAIGAWSLWGRPAAERPLLAVMPFDSVQPGDEAARFAENVAGEMLYVIGQAGPGVDLIGRTSSFSFHGADKTIANIRSQLNPTHVLDGNVSQQGNEVVYTLQLTDAKTGKSIWSERRTGAISGMPSMLAHFSGGVLQALDAFGRNDRRYADVNPEAMRLFLATPCDGCPAPSGAGGYDEAIAALTKAVAIEPGFTRAWQRLALNYAMQRYWVSSDEDVKKAETLGMEAAKKALALAPDDPASLSVYSAFESDQDKFQEVLKRALKIDPTNPTAAVALAEDFGNRGRFRDAVETGYTAATRDPLNMLLGSTIGFAATGLGDADKAEELLIRDKRANLMTLPGLVMAWLVDEKPARADAVLKLLEERAGAGQQPQEIARRQVVAQLRSLVTAMSSGDPVAMAVAAKAIEPLKYEPGKPPPARWAAIAFFGVHLPALARYAGADPAFELWARHIKDVDRINPEKEFDRLFAELHYLLWDGHYDVMAPLQQDPRYWSFVAQHLAAVLKKSPDILQSLGYKTNSLADYVEDNPHWPPDFCTAPGLPYDCTKVAREAFQAVAGRPAPK